MWSCGDGRDSMLKSVGMTFVCSAKEILENIGMMDYRPPANSCR